MYQAAPKTAATRTNPIIRPEYSFIIRWRRGRDSNPRWRLSQNGFQDRRDRPLCHPSTRFPVGRAGGTRTPNRRFWRPLLYQLSYRPTRRRMEFSTICLDEKGGGAKAPHSKQLLTCLSDHFADTTSTNRTTALTNGKTQAFLHGHWRD